MVGNALLVVVAISPEVVVRTLVAVFVIVVGICSIKVSIT